MACGLATIAYDGPIAREVLGQDGIFVPTGDTAALAAACITLLEDAGQRKRRGEALRERAVAEWSWSALASRLVEVYREVGADSAGGEASRAETFATRLPD